MKRRSRPDVGPMPPQFEALATYNAEVYRGIVHTAKYDEFMAELQRRYDVWLAANGEGQGDG